MEGGAKNEEGLTRFVTRLLLLTESSEGGAGGGRDDTDGTGAGVEMAGGA